MPSARQKIEFGFDFMQMEAFATALQGLSPTAMTRVLRDAAFEAGGPVVKAIKQRTPKRTGALRKSISRVARGYSGSVTAVLIVGPNKNRFFGGRLVKRGSLRGADAPYKYAHLVEFGHYLASARGDATRIGFKDAKNTVLDPSRLKPGKTLGVANRFVRAQPFMRPGVAASRGAMINAMRRGLAKGLDRENRRLISKIKRLRKAA